VLVWRGVVWHAMTAVGAFKRVLPLICDAKFGVQRGAGFTVSMLQMLANLNPSQSYTKPSGGCAAGRRTYSEHAADAARRCCGSAFCCYLECHRAVAPERERGVFIWMHSGAIFPRLPNINYQNKSLYLISSLDDRGVPTRAPVP
jgi:hypothetical protein